MAGSARIFCGHEPVQTFRGRDERVVSGRSAALTSTTLLKYLSAATSRGRGGLTRMATCECASARSAFFADTP